jgi:hypothetical protein
VYLDLDPAFTQIWQTQGIDMHFWAIHIISATVGLSIGSETCTRAHLRYSNGFRRSQPMFWKQWPAGKRHRSR